MSSGFWSRLVAGADPRSLSSLVVWLKAAELLGRDRLLQGPGTSTQICVESYENSGVLPGPCRTGSGSPMITLNIYC